MKYSRKIAALLPKGFKKKLGIVLNKYTMHHLARILFLIFLCCVVLLIGLIFLFREELRQKRQEYTMLYNQKIYWVNLAKQYPNAPDILYNAAISAKNIGNEKEAVDYLNQALKLDPLFMEARLLKKTLEE